MKVDLEKEPNNVMKLNIEIPAKDAVDEYNKAVKRIAQHVNIPGFRKGKAPRAIVEQNVGIDRIKHEALEGLLPKAFQKAIMENELDVISQPYVENYDFNIGEVLKVVAKVELRPEVTLGEYKGMKIAVEDYKVPEGAFEKSLENLMQQHSTFEIVVDRPSKDTDVVVFDFDGYVNGEQIKNGEAKNYSLDLSNSNFIPGFAEQLVGHKIDEDFEIKVTFPETYHEEKLAGQEATFKIKIHEIKEKVMPELTDEFAQKVGPFKTVEELKEDITKYLERTKESQNNKNKEQAIFEKVLGNAKVDIQDSMIDREAQSLLEEYKQKLESQGFEWQQAIQSQGEDVVMASLKEEAVLRIKNSLVIDKVSKEENLKLEQGDLEKKLQELGSAYQMDRATIMKQLRTNPEILNSLSQQALNEKVSDFLSENNTVEFVEAKPEKKKAAKKSTKKSAE